MPISSCIRTKWPRNSFWYLSFCLAGRDSIFLTSVRMPFTPMKKTGASICLAFLRMALRIMAGKSAMIFSDGLLSSKVYIMPFAANTPLAKRARCKSSAAQRCTVSNTGSLIR
ncbi:Uncharacterised protein [Mycobacteroides abscessus subsp. massiliense]|nr:Uncharacterised protein [Mycobacteroides abscessus subsp. massiliense]